MLPGAVFASVGRPAGAAWANTKSLRFAGSDTATVGKTSFGQPALWNRNLQSQEFTTTMWFRRNGRDGVLLSSRSDSNGYWYISVSSGQLVCIFGGNFVQGGTIVDNTWYSLTVTVRNESGTYVGRAYLGNSSTSIVNANAGADTLAMDFYLNVRRGSNNTNFSIGSWALHNIDELAFWNVGFTGADHLEWHNSGVPKDARTHSRASGLTNYYRCGDDPADTTSVLKDIVGSINGAHENPANISYPTQVP